MAHKIILDTDPGIDDAMAIFFAFQSPDIDVLGLTTATQKEVDRFLAKHS